MQQPLDVKGLMNFWWQTLHTKLVSTDYLLQKDIVAPKSSICWTNFGINSLTMNVRPRVHIYLSMTGLGEKHILDCSRTTKTIHTSNLLFLTLTKKKFHMGTWDTNMLLLYWQNGAGIAWSVLRLVTGWTVRGSKAGGPRDSLFSTPVQIGSWAHPASFTIGNSTPSLR